MIFDVISDEIFVNFDGRKRSLENDNFAVNVKAKIRNDLEKIAMYVILSNVIHKVFCL